MNAQASIESHFRKLLVEGDEIRKRNGWNGRELTNWPSNSDFTNFRTKAVNLVHRACGEHSSHYTELHRLCTAKETANNSAFFDHVYGILKAAQEDFSSGLLFDLRSLVSADILGDFLEQAETLISHDYYVAAASLCGAALEDGLRKLCDKHSLIYPAKTQISTLNVELYKANVYNNLVQKEVIAKADIRNSADHGKPSEFSKADVKEMIIWTRRFLSERLT